MQRQKLLINGERLKNEMNTLCKFWQDREQWSNPAGIIRRRSIS